LHPNTANNPKLSVGNITIKMKLKPQKLSA